MCLSEATVAVGGRKDGRRQHHQPPCPGTGRDRLVVALNYGADPARRRGPLPPLLHNAYVAIRHLSCSLGLLFHPRSMAGHDGTKLAGKEGRLLAGDITPGGGGGGCGVLHPSFRMKGLSINPTYQRILTRHHQRHGKYGDIITNHKTPNTNLSEQALSALPAQLAQPTSPTLTSPSFGSTVAPPLLSKQKARRI